MKKVMAILTVLAFCGCTSKTDFGPCIGAFDEKDPNLTYKVSAWNLGVGILFFSLILPPIYVVVDETFCPVAKKN